MNACAHTHGWKPKVVSIYHVGLKDRTLVAASIFTSWSHLSGHICYFIFYFAANFVLAMKVAISELLVFFRKRSEFWGREKAQSVR